MPDVANEPTSIEDREARIQEIDARVAELDAEFAGTVMSQPAAEEWEQLNTERDQHAATVAELRLRRQRLQVLAGNPAATERGAAEAPAFVRQRKDEIYDLNSIRSGSRSEDEYRDHLHENARRAIERSRPALYRNQSKERILEHVEDLLMRCDDKHGTFAKRVLITGSPTYQRAFGKYVLTGGTAQLTPEENRALSVGGGSPVGAEGGFAAPFDLDPTVILTSDGEVSPLRQISRVERIAGKTWQGITSAGITVTRSPENEEGTDNAFAIDQPEVSPTRVLATVPFSVEIDQDWPQLRSEVARLLADAKDVEEAGSFVTGGGTGDDPEGIAAGLDAASEVDMTTAGMIELGGDGSAVGLLDLESELPVRFRSRGRFLANKSTYQAVRGLGAGSDGADLWVRLSASQPPELLGYPAHEASAMESLGDADGRVLILGDFQQFLIVDRLGMIVEVQPHVLGATRRMWTGQRAINAMWRNSSLILVDNAFRVLVDELST
jgi:HK97 family phage major capsid protein